MSYESKGVKDLLTLAMGQSGFEVSRYEILNAKLVTQNKCEAEIAFDVIIDTRPASRIARINLSKLFVGESSVKVSMV